MSLKQSEKIMHPEAEAGFSWPPYKNVYYLSILNLIYYKVLVYF